MTIDPVALAEQKYDGGGDAAVVPEDVIQSEIARKIEDYPELVMEAINEKADVQILIKYWNVPSFTGQEIKLAVEDYIRPMVEEEIESDLEKYLPVHGRD